MLYRNRLKISSLIVSGVIFGNMSLFAEDLKEDVVLTPEERICDLENQIIALTDQLEIALGPKSPIAPDESSISAGRALYAKQCQKCHGSRGRGDGPLGKAIRNIQDLTDPSMRNKSDQELFDRITGAPPSDAFF